LLSSGADLQLADEKPLDRFGPVVRKRAGEIFRESLAFLRFASSSDPYCRGVKRVSGLNVFAFAGFDNEIHDFTDCFLSSGYDLFDRLFAGFLVDGAEDFAVRLRKGIEYFLGVHLEKKLGVQIRQGALMGGLRKRLASLSLTKTSLSGS